MMKFYKKETKRKNVPSEVIGYLISLKSKPSTSHRLGVVRKMMKDEVRKASYETTSVYDDILKTGCNV